MTSSVYSVPYSNISQVAWEGIMAESAIDQYIIEAGQSREISEIFNAISEQELSGIKRFRDRDCRTLKKVIACRIYAKPVLELCHMITMARNLDRRGRFEFLFWGVNPVTPVNFRDFIMANLKPEDGNAIATSQGVELSYSDGEYTIRYGRMPFLTAFMDFIVNSIGYEKFLETVSDGTDTTLKSLSVQASALSKQIYNFLDTHLPTVQSQKKFRMIIAYLDDRYGEEFEETNIGDTDLLDFWKMVSASDEGEGANFISYVSVFDAFVRFSQSLEYGQTLKSFNHMGSIGSDREFEEDPDAALGLLDVIDEKCTSIDVLSEHPMSDVKFLNKREYDILSYMLPREAQIGRWPISYLRAEVFGLGQGRITQALRNKTTAEKLLSLIDDSTLESYSDRLCGLKKTEEYLQRLLLACLYVAKQSKSSDDGTVQTIDFDTLGRAKKAFQSISRKGFEEDALGDEIRIQSFEGATDSIVQIKESLAQVNQHLSHYGDWEQVYEEDCLTFSKQFGYIYGGER